jgi:hypothetical protein
MVCHVSPALAASKTQRFFEEFLYQVAMKLW